MKKSPQPTNGSALDAVTEQSKRGGPYAVLNAQNNTAATRGNEHGGADKGVSRRHARILSREAQVYIEDLDSSNGTYVNRTRLAPHQEKLLCDRDTIWLGHLELVFAASSDPPD